MHSAETTSPTGLWVLSPAGRKRSLFFCLLWLFGCIWEADRGRRADALPRFPVLRLWVGNGSGHKSKLGLSTNWPAHGGGHHCGRLPAAGPRVRQCPGVWGGRQYVPHHGWWPSHCSLVLFCSAWEEYLSAEKEERVGKCRNVFEWLPLPRGADLSQETICRSPLSGVGQWWHIRQRHIIWGLFLFFIGLYLHLHVEFT